jgi:hemerythrin-like domain-containing protein
MVRLGQAGDLVEQRFVEQEHREITHGLGRITEVAELAGSLAAPDLSSSVRNLVRWLETTLMPHLAWEDQWLYPRLGERVGSEWPVRLMRFEHVQLRRAVCALEIDLDGLRHEPMHAGLLRLRADLYALDALIRAHLEREDSMVLPALEADDTPAIGSVGGGGGQPVRVT